MPLNASQFEQVIQVPQWTSAGPCDLPIIYRDGSLLGLGYLVDPGTAASAFGHLPLEPLTRFGRALALVCCFEYRDTTIGAYKEVGIGIFAVRKGRRPSMLAFLCDMRDAADVGLYIATLPVSNEISCAAGVELWGFPKYVTEIETSFGSVETQIRLGRELIVTHRRGMGISAKGMPFVPYTIRDGRLIRTFVEVGHRVRFGGASTVTLTVHGDGPSARVVRMLDLDSRKPVFAFRTDTLSSLLPQGNDLGPI